MSEVIEFYPEFIGSMPKQVYALAVKAPTGEVTAKGRPCFRSYVLLFADKPSFDRQVEVMQQPGMMSTGFGDQQAKTFVGRIEWEQTAELEAVPWQTKSMSPMPFKKGKPEKGVHTGAA